MSFYQNLFNQEFRQSYGNLIFDGQPCPVIFDIPANRNGDTVTASYNSEPYDFSTYNTLTINYAIDRNFSYFAAIAVNVAGSTPSATTATEVMTALNNNATFASRFTAFAEPAVRGGTTLRVKIRSVGDRVAQRSYISNTSAECILQFNRYASIVEAPLHFQRHSIANRFTYTDSIGTLMPLSHPITANTVANPSVVTSANHGLTTGDSILIVNSNSTPVIDGTRTVTVTGTNTFTVPVNVTTTAGTHGEWMSAYEQTMITNAGFTPANLKDDWELLSGRSGSFTFKKQTVDSSSRITKIIEYPAGAVAGDMAKETQYTYTSTYTSPDTIIVIPHVLTSGDLITPS